MLCFQVDQYLQQLQELEILASRVQTSGQPADYIELERKMREAEELFQRILRDAEILQGNSCLPKSLCGLQRKQMLQKKGHS